MPEPEGAAGRGAAGHGPRLGRWGWGDTVLLLLPAALLLLAASDAAQLAAPERADAWKAFLLSWLAATGVAGLWGVGYLLRRGRPGPTDVERARRRRAAVVAAPGLGLAGVLLWRQLEHGAALFALYGAGGGFLLAVMLGYAAYVLARRRGTT